MISVIIPVLNEDKILEKTLYSLQPELTGHELIIVDGGSSDTSVEIAKKYGTVIISVKGRGKQLNAGAEQANGEIFVFLHADVWLEEGAIAAVGRAITCGYVGGGFIQKIEGKNILYRIIEKCANLRGKYLKIFYGDSGIFITRDGFQQIGGFPDVPIMEEMEFSKALHKLGETVMISPRIHISARRWETGGIIRTTLINWLITILYILGFSTDRLAQLYKNIR